VQSATAVVVGTSATVVEDEVTEAGAVDTIEAAAVETVEDIVVAVESVCLGCFSLVDKSRQLTNKAGC
jgi:hypothetical protein